MRSRLTLLVVGLCFPILGFTTVFHAPAGMSNELVCKFTRNLFEHKADYHMIHIPAKEMAAENVHKGHPDPDPSGGKEVSV